MEIQMNVIDQIPNPLPESLTELQPNRTPWIPTLSSHSSHLVFRSQTILVDQCCAGVLAKRTARPPVLPPSSSTSSHHDSSTQFLIPILVMKLRWYIAHKQQTNQNVCMYKRTAAVDGVVCRYHLLEKYLTIEHASLSSLGQGGGGG